MSAGPGVHEELTALAAAEQTCCSVVTWAVSVIGDQLVLRVTAPPEQPEAVASIAALFGRHSPGFAVADLPYPDRSG